MKLMVLLIGIFATVLTPEFSIANSSASSTRMSYVLGIPNFGGSASDSAELKKEWTYSNKIELTHLSNLTGGYLVSIGIGQENSDYYLPQTPPTPSEFFESDLNFYFLQLGYRFELSHLAVKPSIEVALSLGTGNMNFKRDGGTKKRLNNVGYQAIDLKYASPFQFKENRFDWMLGLGVSKATVQDFNFESTRFNGKDFKTAFLLSAGLGYYFNEK